MPAHWYYDRAALQRDYGSITELVAPRPEHPDSILWRSTYRARNSRGEILHDQARYWGQRGVHYHQFLRAGENTLNLQLATLALRSIDERGGYDADDYLRRAATATPTSRSATGTSSIDTRRASIRASARRWRSTSAASRVRSRSPWRFPEDARRPWSTCA